MHTSSSLSIAGIHRIALQVPDVGRVEKFYRDVWRMRAAGAEDRYLAFRTAMAGHSDFLIAQGPRQIDHVAFAVRSEEALSRLTERLETAGFTASEVRGAGLLRGDRRAVAVRDPDGRLIWLVVPGRDAAEAPYSSEPLAPQRIGHIVLWTPTQPRTEAFYTLLGFQVSDRTSAGMSFLRCNADHHTLALMKSTTGRTGVQHIAFDVSSLDNVMRNYARLRDCGVTCSWGVGRHGPGNNIFSYYVDPAGNFVEYYGEMEQFPANGAVETRIWGPEHKGDVWGVVGAPPPAFGEQSG